MTQARHRVITAPGGQQGFDANQFGLLYFGRRRGERARQLVGNRQGVIWAPSAGGHSGSQGPQSERISSAGVAAIGPVGRQGLAQIRVGRLVISAQQGQLGQRVEDAPANLMELHGTPRLEALVQDALRAGQIAQTEQYLAEVGQRPRKAGTAPSPPLEGDGLLGEHPRLPRLVTQGSKTGLIAVHHREHVAGTGAARQSFGPVERGVCFAKMACLGQHRSREGMQQGQRAPIAGAVKRHRRIGDVLPENAGVTDLPEGLCQREMRLPERTSIRAGELYGPLEPRDRRCLFAAVEGQPPPDTRQC